VKKIIHITNDLQRLGGVQRLLVDLMTLQKNDFEFEVILTRGENEYQDELREIGVKVYHKRDLGLWGVVKRLNKADLVHAHLFPSMYIALLSSSIKIVTEHNPNYRRRGLLLVRVLESVLFRRFARVVCISEGVENSFNKTLRWNEGRSLVLNNGVNLNRFSMSSKVIKTPPGVLKIGMVGRLVSAKDVVTLIKMISSLGLGFELHLAGDGELREVLEVKAVELNVQDQVFFHGQLNDIPKFLSGLDVYVQSSNWEGFGLAVVEAMASGLPCIATNVAGLNEIVCPEYLFEVGDVSHLCTLVYQLKNDVNTYNRQAELSVTRATEFSIETAATNHSRLYENLLSQSSVQ